MELKLIEQSENKVKIEIDDMTIVNLIHEQLWKDGKIDYSAWTREHPYLAKPVLLVKAKDPKKALLDAADSIITDVEKIRKQFEKEK